MGSTLRLFLYLSSRSPVDSVSNRAGKNHVIFSSIFFTHRTEKIIVFDFFSPVQQAIFSPSTHSCLRFFLVQQVIFSPSTRSHEQAQKNVLEKIGLCTGALYVGMQQPRFSLGSVSQETRTLQRFAPLRVGMQRNLGPGMGRQSKRRLCSGARKTEGILMEERTQPFTTSDPIFAPHNSHSYLSCTAGTA